MLFANEWDIANYWHRFGNANAYGEAITPNLAAAVRTLDNLREWTDSHSDGWAYWPKPCRSAARLIAALNDAEYNDRAHSWDEPEDIDRSELTKACAPIKAFLTRQGVAHDEIIVNPTQEA